MLNFRERSFQIGKKGVDGTKLVQPYVGRVVAGDGLFVSVAALRMAGRCMMQFGVQCLRALEQEAK